MALVDTALFVGGPEFDVRTKDCLFFTLLAEKELTARLTDGTFCRFKIPQHAESDGASLPLFAQALKPTLRERIFGPAFAHDACYRGTMLLWDDGKWIAANLDQAQSDSLIRALMFLEAVSDAEQEIVYEALRMFGKAAFRADRSTTPPPPSAA